MPAAAPRGQSRQRRPRGQRPPIQGLHLMSQQTSTSWSPSPKSIPECPTHTKKKISKQTNKKYDDARSGRKVRFFLEITLF